MAWFTTNLCALRPHAAVKAGEKRSAESRIARAAKCVWRIPILFVCVRIRIASLRVLGTQGAALTAIEIIDNETQREPKEKTNPGDYS